MNLHNEIMNIPTGQLQEMVALEEKNLILVYRMGHRDARHAAAELSLKAEARIEELENSLKWVLEGFKSILGGKAVRDADEIVCNVDKVLENKQ